LAAGAGVVVLFVEGCDAVVDLSGDAGSSDGDEGGDGGETHVYLLLCYFTILLFRILYFMFVLSK
jgi:hypothetical protein